MALWLAASRAVGAAALCGIVYGATIHSARAGRLAELDARRSQTTAALRRPGLSVQARGVARSRLEKWQGRYDDVARHLSISRTSAAELAFEAASRSAVSITRIEPASDGDAVRLDFVAQGAFEAIPDFLATLASYRRFELVELDLAPGEAVNGDSVVVAHVGIRALTPAMAGVPVSIQLAERSCPVVRRDPFGPAPEAALSGLTLVGLARDATTRLALLEADDGIGYVVRAGSWLPQWQATVASVDGDHVDLEANGRIRRLAFR